MGFQFTNMKQFQKKVQEFGPQTQQKASQVCSSFWISVFTKSKEYTPVSSGHLKNSAYLKQLDQNTYEIVYPALYSVYVHELQGVAHRQGMSKFLTRAIQEHSGKLKWR